MAKRKGNRRRSRYSDEFRASAVLMLEASGYPGKDGVLIAVSRRLDVPNSTLRGWFLRKHNPPPSEVHTRKHFDLVQAIRDELEAIVPELANARQDASYRDLVTGFAILVDKQQLLQGASTEITEQRITIERNELSSVPQHLALRPDRSDKDVQEGEYKLLREKVGEDAARNGRGV